jgi:cellulose synthase/poly-beta-1,6-N-acetylglucosamine synthase-like glycosyltransferase
MSAMVAALFAPFFAWWGLWAAQAARARGVHRPSGDGRPKRIDVVVPAHNEAANVGALVASLSAQGGRSTVGRVLVVADHCTDDTTAVAAAAGAEVLDRRTGAAGKPPALAEGVATLRARADRGDAVVLLDADCVCQPGFIDALARRLGPDDRVVQAAYTLHEPDRGAVRGSLELGFALRNVVRASGADGLGLPVVLFGSGMLLAWDVVDHLSWGDPRITGTGDSRPVADDVLMALELLAHGIHPRLAIDAGITAPTPDDEQALGAQRLRWEGGQALMWRRVPVVARRLAGRRDWRGLVGLVDWVGPPLVPSVVAFAGLTVVVVGGVAGGAVAPVALLAPVAAGALLGTYLVLGVHQLQGRAGVVALATRAPRFVAWKASLYLRHRSARRTGVVG